MNEALSTFVQQVINGLAVGSTYALVGLGYTMVFGVLREINFWNSELFMLGGLAAFIALRWAGVVSGFAGLIVRRMAPIDYVWSVALAFIAAAGFATLVALVMERLVSRPLRNAPGGIAVITSLGGQLFLRYGAIFVFSARPYGFPRLVPTAYWEIGGVVVNSYTLFIMAVTAALLGILLYIVHYTDAGRCMRAVSEDAAMSGMLGVNVTRTVQLVFVISACVAGISGVLWSMLYSQANYGIGAMVGMKAWTAAVLGGVGNVPGAVGGGLVLGIVEALGGGYIHNLSGGLFGAEYRDVFSFVILVLVLIFRPTGLFGQAVEGKKK